MSSTSQAIRPGRIWYALAAIVLAGGIAVFVILLVSFITDLTGMARSMTRVVAPGTFDITLDQPGNYTLFDEYQSVVDGQVYHNPGGLGGLTCTLTDKATGRKIPLIAASTTATYTTGAYAGRSVFDFTIPSPGVYTLTAQYARGAGGSQAVLSIDHGFLGGIVGSIIKMFGAIGVLTVSIVLSILIFVLTIVRRNRASRRLQENPA